MAGENQGILGENFPNPADEEHSYEDAMDDLKREQDEKAGLAPVPFKTVSFWLSLIATILVYLSASGVLPVQINEWVLIAVVALAHLGYGAAANYFKKNPDGLQASDGTPNYKRPAFYASFAAVLAGYALGSGHETAEAAAGSVGMILAYLGYATRPWIKRRQMVTADTEQGQADLIFRLLSILLFITTKKPLPKQREQK